MNLGKIFKNGIIDQNPTFVQLVSLCPLLAVTTSAMNAINMGIATTIVMVCACMVVSLVRRFIPNEVRIAAFVIIVAGFVTTLQLAIEAFSPAINEQLGIFIPLIVVNCILFSRLESFASKNTVIPSAVDALGMGLGLTLGLLVIGVIREVLGNGTLFDIELMPEATSHILIMIMAPGAFFTLGASIMVIKYFQAKRRA